MSSFCMKSDYRIKSRNQKKKKIQETGKKNETGWFYFKNRKSDCDNSASSKSFTIDATRSNIQKTESNQ